VVASAVSAARIEILRRVRMALDDGAPGPRATPVPARTVADPVELFAERVADYRAGVTLVGDEAEIGEAVAAALARHGAARAVVPADLPRGWLPSGLTVVVDGPPIAHDALAAVDAVVTGCAIAVAETGTFVLDGGVAQGRRAITLLPDVHVCVVGAEQVVGTVPDAIARLAGVHRPVTFVSGPSATSDIGFVRVEGVHGPRSLEVIVVRRPPPGRPCGRAR
jgi:L-lactate dehydrogenase complex protein LldG